MKIALPLLLCCACCGPASAAGDGSARLVIAYAHDVAALSQTAASAPREAAYEEYAAAVTSTTVQAPAAVPAKPAAPVPAAPAGLVTAAEMHQRGLEALQASKETEAVEWFRKAAVLGNAGAQYGLGLMYAVGRGGLRKDEAQAADWYRKAAEQGEANAQNVLGLMYAEGRGRLPKDMARAAEWLRKSAAQGNPYAPANLERLGIKK